MMKDTWCKRLAIIAATWVVLAIALQVVTSVALR